MVSSVLLMGTVLKHMSGCSWMSLRATGHPGSTHCALLFHRLVLAYPHSNVEAQERTNPTVEVLLKPLLVSCVPLLITWPSPETQWEGTAKLILIKLLWS